MGAIDNNTPFIQIMARRRAGDKPQSEPSVASMGDAHMRHTASMSYTILQLYLRQHSSLYVGVKLWKL